MGGAERTFACKSQECLWQDWYICILICLTDLFITEYNIKPFKRLSVSIFSSDLELEEITEPEVKELIMPTKSGRREKVTFRVG